jgi:hypothetical protein
MSTRFDRTKVTAAMASGAAASATVVSCSADRFPAKVYRFVVAVPNYTNSPNTTVSIINRDGILVYQTAAMAKNASYSIPTDVDTFAGDSIEVETSADIGSCSLANRTVGVEVDLERE